MAPEQVDDEQQRRAERARYADLMMRLATKAETLTESVDRLDKRIAGTPNLLERVATGHVRNAIAALIIVVALSSLVATATAFAWRDSWESSPRSLRASAK